MKWFSVVIGVLGILLTVKPFIRSANWFIRLGDFPRLQIIGLLTISLLSYLSIFSRTDIFGYIFLACVMACLAFQARAVLPFTRLHRKEVQNARAPDLDDTNLSLLIYNVLMENDRFSEALAMIEQADADVVLLAEPDQKWERALEPLKEKYQFSVARILDNHYGMMLFSRLEISETSIDFIIQKDIPSIHTKIKLRSGDEIAFHGIHPRPPVPEEQGRSTERDGELLLVGKAVRDSNLPVIVAGDMNDAAWSYTTRLFKRISGLLDPRVGRGFFNTFHAQYRLFRLPLDHIFHSHHFRLIELRRLNDSCGSDHFPVFAFLSIEEDARREQSRPVPLAVETEEAHAMVAEAVRTNRFRRLSITKIKDKIIRIKRRISRRK
jgi:endonuclease/exonuclease/phosphatase (EEP) superfamily protein YafD